jgi:flagellar biogenesis protein FliO
MVEYTTYIPEEIFLGRVSTVHIFIVLIIILAIIVFFSYSFYKVFSIKRKPESF